MFSRILLGAISMAAGCIVVSAASAAGPDAGVSVTASVPLPELTVAPPTDYRDVRLLNGSASSSEAAFDSTNPKRLVVGIWSGRECYLKRSADGGKTWGAFVQLPQFAGGECQYLSAFQPAVTYAADGGRLYAAYAYIAEGSSGVAISVSTDRGATWSAPMSALPAVGMDEGDGFIDVRLAAAPDSPWVYVAANWSTYHGTETLVFSSSGNQGSGWTPGIGIARGDPEGGPFLRGFALAAGRGGAVFLAYGLGDDYLYQTFNHTVKVARSADHGASFLYGTADQYSTTDPDDASLVLSDPHIKIGPVGTAHVVYAKGGEAILYKYSYPPYSTWSAESVRLDDGVTQANVAAPHLAVGACGQASILHATWGESPDVLDYWPSNILYTRKVAQRGYAWSEPVKVGELKGGIHRNDLAAAGAKAFSVFSGRTAPDPQHKWGIAGSRVSSGVTCP